MLVRFFATLRPLVGGRHVEVDHGGGITVQALLDELVQRHPPLGPELFERDGDLYRHVHVFVNGRDVRYLEGGMGTVLTGAEKLDIFPAVGGGAVPVEPPSDG